MLKIECMDHLEDVKQFAKNMNCESQLSEKLEYLKNYGGGDRVCLLYKDFAPYSFGFAILEKGTDRCVLNGGLIFESRDCPANGSAPSFTVSLGGPRTGWFVHT